MNLKDYSIAICSIVRNARPGLVRNVPVIQSLCSLFKDYRVVIFENDSTDGTDRFLEEWAEKDPKVHVSCRKLGVRTIPRAEDVTCNPFFSKWRNEKMSGFRNQYLEYVESMDMTPDFLVVVDLDVAQLYLDGILSSFTDAVDWDVVTSYGYSLSPKLSRRYHDTYALVEYGCEDIPQTEESIVNASYRFAKVKPTDPWIRVFSAFGGLAIYRYPCIRGLRYMSLDNADPRVACRAEHYSIYYQMKQRGFDRVYINPAMTLKYQRLSAKIIWNHLKRSLHR